MTFRAVLILGVLLGLSGCGFGDDVAVSTVPVELAPSTTVVPTTSSVTDASTTTAAPVATVPVEQLSLLFVEVGSFDEPVDVFLHPITSEAFVVEKAGLIVGLESDRVLLDVTGEVSRGTEQGLLGATFNPAGDSLYINYTDRSGDTIVKRYEMSGSSLASDSGAEILKVPQDRGNHNGGHLAFGPDGYLYIGLGDGGGSGDPKGHGQNTGTLLGAMLRIAPTSDGYLIPPDNPFADGVGGAQEIFAWGLRNPWRYSFDNQTGDLWIGDVGQNEVEEVSVARAADGGGKGFNFGWNTFEGDERFARSVEIENHASPIFSYPQANGRCSVTGGVVYRGSNIPSLVGHYVFGDFCSGEIFAISGQGQVDTEPTVIGRVEQVASFAMTETGEILIVSLKGKVFQLQPS